LVLGGGLALGSARLLQSLLFGVSANDPLTLGAAAIALLGIAMIATAGPVVRAARTDPAVVLRTD